DPGQGEFPLSPVLNERYEYAVVFCTNETEWAMLQTKLGLQREQDYKSSQVATGRVIPFAKFMELWDARDNENHHTQPQAVDDNDGAPGDPSGRSLRPGKPDRSLPDRKPRRKSRSPS